MMSNADEMSARKTAELPAPLLAKIFIASLAIRWIYAIAMYAFMGDDGLKGLDSITYAANGSDFAEALRSGAIHGSQWFGKDYYSMPLFHVLAALPFLIVGKTYGCLGYVLMQGVLDAGTCVIVAKIALQFSRRIAIAAGIVAVLNPTQIVMSGLFYTDTPFVFFVALSIYCSFKWADVPSLRSAIWLGLALGCAGLTRSVMVPWAFFALAALAVYVLIRKIPLPRAATIVAALAGLCLCVSVIVAKNYMVFGTPALTPQGGAHLALWIVPLAKEMQDRTPYMTSLTEMQRRTTERFGPLPDNPFEQSAQYTAIAKEAMKDIPFAAFAKSWLSGMTINLVSPGVLLSPAISKLPRTGFYDTPGNSFFDKAFNYAFRSGQPAYTWSLLIGSIGLVMLRLLQAIGAIALLRHAANWPRMLFMASWVGYILLVNGPVASPKYRLPMEPVFNILAGAGLVAIRDRRVKAQDDARRQEA